MSHTPFGAARFDLFNRLLSVYTDHYHDFVDQHTGSSEKGTEIITEIYVPHEALLPFMESVKKYFREEHVNLIYGTIRRIEPDTESFLAWARQAWTCIVFNLHTEHTSDGIRHSACAFRHLIDLAISVGGTYSLTYHRFATRKQIESCYPQFRNFLKHKKHFDPTELFQSDWYAHHVRLFEE